MTNEDIKTWVEVAKAAALAIGGAWSLWLFTIQRRFAPMIEFDVETNVVPHADGAILECGLILHNRGLARQKVKSIRLTVRGIRRGGALTTLNGFPGKVAFPLEIVNRASLIPERWGFTFIDPGIAQRYSYPVPLPPGIGTVMVHAAFKYRNGWKHTAERIFPIPLFDKTTANFS